MSYAKSRSWSLSSNLSCFGAYYGLSLKMVKLPPTWVLVHPIVDSISPTDYISALQLLPTNTLATQSTCGLINLNK